MNQTFLLYTEAWEVALLLFLLMIVSVFLGSKLGKNRFKDHALKQGGTSVSYLSGLLFFLLAFTFGMGGNRFDARRAVVIQEANAIGTAILRADLYPEKEKQAFRKDFKNYLEARIAYYEFKAEIDLVLKADSLSKVASGLLWKRAARLSADPSLEVASRLMIPALNELIDLSTTRFYGELAKVPESIVWMLLILACINAFYMGYASVSKGTTDWLVEIGFCLLVSLVVLFTLDVDRPRRGFINLDTPNKAIKELRMHFENT